MSKLRLEEEVAGVLSATRSNPRSLVPHLQELDAKFIGVTPIVALTATRRLRIPEGKDAVQQAIAYLNSREPVSAVGYSWGMSEAARAKFTSNDTLTDRLKSRGQWTGTCSDFVQLGVEDLDAYTIVALMVISAGDPNRQIRERIFSADKGAVGVAIGPYKQSVGVAVTLATKFVANAPTEQEERAARAAASANVGVGQVQDVSRDVAAAMQSSARPKGDDYSKSDGQIESERSANLARLDGNRGAQVREYDEGDDEMAAIQRERMAKLAALERSNASSATPVDPAMPPGYGYVEHDAPARDLAYDPNIESYEEAEARKRAFFEQQERAKREAMEKAEAQKKASWQAERKAREEAKKREEEERLRRLQEDNKGFGRPPARQAAAAPMARAAAPAPVARQASVPINRSVAPAPKDEKDDEMDAFSRERMAKIAALEHNNPHAGTSSAQPQVDPDEHVSDALQPDPYDPTKESYEEAEARKRAFFEQQERAKREAVEKAQEAQKNAWKAERAAREEAKKREEAERIRRLQDEGLGGARKFGAGGVTAPAASKINRAPAPVAAREVVRSTPAATSYEPIKSPRGVEDDNLDPTAKEEARLAAMISKRGGGFGKVDELAHKEAERKRMEQERQEREAKMAALREQKWKEESLKAEQAAKQRAAEAEAKARALAAGVVTPSMAPLVQHTNQVVQRDVMHAAPQHHHHEPEPQYEAEPEVTAQVEESIESAQPDHQQEDQQYDQQYEQQEQQYEQHEEQYEQHEEVGAYELGHGTVEQALAELSQCGEETPVRLYLNALVRPEESVEITSLADVREGVSYYAGTGHIVLRTSKYTLLVGDQTLHIPAAHLLNDDFNSLSDYFFFATSPHLVLYPSAEREAEEEMQVSNLADLELGKEYYLPSGNFVVLHGGENPAFLLDGQREIALPDEVVDALRGQ